jgi:hypothetical protein
MDGRRIGVRFQVGTSNTFLVHKVQTTSGAHPASYTIRTGAVSPG